MVRNKKKFSEEFSSYYEELSQELSLKSYVDKSLRIKTCFDVQLWDKYEINKIMDNQANFQCKDSFCLNSQIMTHSKYAHALKPIVDDFIKEGLKPYMLTLTVPNCKFEELNDTIKKMNDMYNKLFKKLNADNERKFKQRYMKIYGSVKVLEVTINNITKTFHPHFHILVLLENPQLYKDNEKYLKPYIEGRYSYNKGSYNMHSLFSIQITKLWTMLYNGTRITKKSFENLTDDPKSKEYLEINLVEFDNYLELLKYTAKFDDIMDYEVFKHLFFALKGKRRIQCSGVIQGLIDDIEDDDDIDVGEEIELYLEFEEEPVKLVTKKLIELNDDEKKEYKKIYRKKSKGYDKDFYTQYFN